MGQHRIFLLEDELDLVEIITSRLTHAGYEVIVANSIESARKLIPGEEVSLYILDIMLPDGSGKEILDLIRGDESTRNIPVIFLTGLGMRDHIEDGFARGANAYLVKPFSGDQLVKAIGLLIKERSTCQE